jgi:hypothetical protein
MSQQALLKRIVEVLEKSGVAYMLTGSVASSLQGEPRSTHDIDLVVAIQAAAVECLTRAFPSPSFHLDPEAMMTAIDQRGMFNLLELREGDKIDFWLLTDEPFDQSRFSRRQAWDIAGMRIQVSRPEDTILMKLRWAQMSGGSEKQFTDALRVYEVQFGVLELEYLEQWARRLGIDALWMRLKNEAQVLP